MRRNRSFIPPTLALLCGVAACTGAATREVCPPPAPCPPPASCPQPSTAPAAEAPPVAVTAVAAAPQPPSPGGIASGRSVMIVTLPTEGKLAIQLEENVTSDERWGCHPPPGKVQVAQQPGRIDLHLLEPTLPSGHGGPCRASVRLVGEVTVGPLARGEWLIDPKGATFWRVRFEGSDGRSVDLR